MNDPAQVRGTQLGKVYLKQYNASNSTELPLPPFMDMVSLPTASNPPLDESKPKEVIFDKF